MSVNLEVKGKLAKLLATEDLIIENKKVDTAMFNVDTRVLTLPMWERASNEVYDMLVSHEVGHALFTPNEDPQINVPMQFINVTEDARVEKLMKRKYGGINKTFYRGYEQLNNDDFFSLEGQNIEKMNLADRANLLFKIGNFIDIRIDEGEETEIIKAIADAETFMDAQIAAEMLYNYCKKELEKESNIQQEPNNSQENSGSSEGEVQSETQETEEVHGEIESPQSTQGTSSPDVESDGEDGEDGEEGGESSKEEPEVKTDDTLNSKLKDLINSNAISNEYVEISDFNLDTIINSNKQVHEYIMDHFSIFSDDNIFDVVDGEYKIFKKTSQKEVNYLVKEFECKKSADAYSRTTVSRTGVLDCTKLHTYKYNEDLFKKVSVIPDGKNHGLIFILDWSGSMTNVIMDTVKQLYNLIWFCKKVSIPFRVYAFTYEFNCVTYDLNGKANMLKPHYKKREGIFAVDDRFSLMEFFTSDVSSKELETQMKNIWRCVYAISKATDYSYPHRLSLSGTPLNESLLCLHQIIPEFQCKNKLQKVQCVILTDGESNHLTRHKKVQRHWEKDSYIGNVSLNNHTYLRNRKTGKTYKVPLEWYKFTNILLQNLKDEFSMVNFIGFRLIDRDGTSFIRRYCGYYGDEYNSAMKQWKKDKVVSIKSSGYQRYFGISSNSLSKTSEFSVEENATKSQIKRAFVNSLGAKKLNKKILGEFVEMIV